MGSSNFTEITCPWGGAGQNEGLRESLLPPGASLFQKHMPCFFKTLTNICNQTKHLKN